MLLIALAPVAAQAVDKFSFSADRVEGQDWLAENVRMELGLNDSGSITITQLDLPEPVGKIRNAVLRCPRLLTTAKGIECRNGTATLGSGVTHARQFPVSLRYLRGNGSLALTLTGVPTRAGAMTIRVHYGDTGWQLNMQGSSLSLASLIQMTTPLLETLQDVSVDGTAELQATLEGSGDTLSGFSVVAALQLDALDALQSTIAAEAVKGKLQIDAGRETNGLHLNVEIAGELGQFYADPVLADFSANPAKIRLQLLQHADGLKLESAQIDQAGSLHASLKGEIELSPAFQAHAATLEVTSLEFPAGYQLLQPFLIGTPADSMETAGKIRGRASLKNNALSSLDIHVDELHLDDMEGRFALYDARGEIHWSASAQAPPSRVRWGGGQLYKLDLDESEIAFAAAKNRFSLTQSLSQPLLDGALNIREFEADRIGEQDMRLRFNAEVIPIDLTQLTRALGWPEFGGTLSGSLPTLEFANQQLVLHGTLQAQLFDGELRVENLRIEDPLGDFPELYGNIHARNLDLEQATDAFSFGRIQGRLNADVESLALLQWQPVAFDARLYTPPARLLKGSVEMNGETFLNDKPHRISQRAIENISDIGGSGAAGVLSRGFLGFFDEFAYDQISLGCVLKDGICRMQGLQPKGDGYYIVKGRLLPRIDVIGFASQVSWPSLLAQLKQISAAESPVVD